MEDGNKVDRNDEVFSKVVRAGKRTYFFDIKSTRNNDLYITLTESKKTFGEHGPNYQKHKIFLYKEDFEKFRDSLVEVIDKVDELKNNGEYAENIDNSVDTSQFSSVDFDELG